MTLDEFIDALTKYSADGHGDDFVIISTDAEGNEFREVDSIAHFIWDGDSVGFAELTEELEEAGYDEDDVIDGDPAIVIYPI